MSLIEENNWRSSIDFPEDRGRWVAYYLDMSSFAIFQTELEAYRYAAGRCMSVKFLEYGRTVNQD